MISRTASGTDTATRITEVAARLLHQEGPAAVTTRGVAAAAGVQAPTIYRLFGDKDGLLEAVAEHVLATYVSAKAATAQMAAAGEVDPVAALRDGWDRQIDFALAHPALFRLLSDPARAMHSPAARSGRQVLESKVHRVAAAGRLRVSERRAVDLLQVAAVGTVHLLLATPAEQRDPGLADATREAVLDQMLTDPPGRTDNGAVTVAVSLRAIAPGLDMLSDPERRLLTEWLDRIVATPLDPPVDAP